MELEVNKTLVFLIPINALEISIVPHLTEGTNLLYGKKSF